MIILTKQVQELNLEAELISSIVLKYLKKGTEKYTAFPPPTYKPVRLFLQGDSADVFISLEGEEVFTEEELDDLNIPPDINIPPIN
jgi:hypothetical protein